MNVEPDRYRIEWRPHLTTRWGLIRSVATPTAADDQARVTLAEHGGFVRVVEQRLVAANDRPGAWVGTRCDAIADGPRWDAVPR